MARGQELLFAVVGAGDLALEKVRSLRDVDAATTYRVYRDLVTRGRGLTTKVKSSGQAKRAAAQTKAARSQVKAAATSVTKAARANAGAAKTAASKGGAS